MPWAAGDAPGCLRTLGGWVGTPDSPLIFSGMYACEWSAVSVTSCSAGHRPWHRVEHRARCASGAYLRCRRPRTGMYASSGVTRSTTKCVRCRLQAARPRRSSRPAPRPVNARDPPARPRSLSRRTPGGCPAPRAQHGTWHRTVEPAPSVRCPGRARRNRRAPRRGARASRRVATRLLPSIRQASAVIAPPPAAPRPPPARPSSATGPPGPPAPRTSPAAPPVPRPARSPRRPPRDRPADG